MVVNWKFAGGSLLFSNQVQGGHVRKMLVGALACALLIFGVAYAQSDRGTITGTIADASGAMIPNAPIEAKNVDTGAVYQAASSDTGNYTLSQLPVGTYQLSVSVSGFKQYLRTGLRVMVAQTLRIDVKLEIGNIAETVTVSAETPLLKTESGELSHVVTSDRLDDLPIMSVAGGIRSAYASTDLLPGASRVSGGFGTLRVNGAPGSTMSLRIEGQDATQTAWTTAYGMSQPGVDSVEETAIETSNYSAEYGQAGGGVFNMTMRSGTNRIHGSGFEYYVNENFNAGNPFYLGAEKPRNISRRHDYGFTFGGPVYIPKVFDGRDKTFFFFSFEQNKQSLTVTGGQATVPTDAFRNGDFSSLLSGKSLGLDVLGRDIKEGAIYDPATTRTVTVGMDSYVVRDPFPNNKIPTERFDKVASNFQALIPHANVAGAVTNNYRIPAYSNEPLTSIYSIKMDHNISSKLKISGYWSLNDIRAFFPDGFAPPITTERDLYETTHTVRLSMDYSVSPTMMLHLGAGIMRFLFTDDVPNINYDNLKELGLPGTLVTRPPTFNSLGSPQGGLGSTSGQGNSAGPVAQQNQWSDKPTATASLTWVRSNHTYKFGGEMRVESYPSLTTTPANGWFTFSSAQTSMPYLNNLYPGGGYVGNSYASFLLGQIDRGEIGQPSKFHMGKHALSLYFQDSWKVSPKLTLDYGLRYDFQTYLKETYGRVPSFSPTTPNPAYNNILGAVIFEGSGEGRCNCDYAKNYPYAFGPRLGVAYQITPKTVIRGGWGITYGQTANLEMWSLRFGSDEVYTSPGFGLPVTGTSGQDWQLEDGPPFAPTWPNFDPGQRPKVVGDRFMTWFDNNAGRPPRQIMWSIGIQREITPNLSAEISYVGNRGAWWMSNGSLTDPNRVTPAILAANGLSLDNADDRALLTSSISSAQVIARGFTKPFPSFPDSKTLAQALRPFPQFGPMYVLWAPLGNTWYDSLQIKVTKRYSHGLDFTAAYSYQKEYTIGAETFDPAFAPVQPAVNNLNDWQSNKTISGLSIPHRIVIAGNYTLPTLDVYKPLSWLIRDWTIGAVMTYSSGAPIRSPAANNNLANQLQLCAPMSVLGGCNTNAFFDGAPASYANRVPGEPVFLQDLNAKFDPFNTFVLNPAAWADPAPGQFGTGPAYYSDYRYRRVPQENMSFGRMFRFREGMSAQVRIEFTNIFNRNRIPNPTADNALATQQKNPNGTTKSGFGYINPLTAGGQRSGQMVIRFNF
jgi:hypothetical protein